MTPAGMPEQSARNRQKIHFAEKDRALRDDVRRLGKLVGELLLEQGGEALFKSVESARRWAIARREGDDEATARLDELLNKLSASSSRDVVRAFSTYFQVVNTAEQVHRIRRRRQYLQDSGKRQARSFDETFFNLRETGLDADAVRAVLDQLAIQPVFTEHPTETTRRTILRKQQNIVRRMVEFQNPALTPHESRACFANIRSDVTAIWQTEESPSESLTVFDELEHTLFFMTDVIYRVVPPFYEAIESALTEAYGDSAQGIDIPDILRFGSWIGGDLSTYGEVSARSIRETLARQRALLLNLYYRDCRELSGKLSQSTARVEVDEAVFERIERYGKQFPGTHASTPHRHRSMPYRMLLRLICQRLQATFDEAAFPYESAQQFSDDLRLIAASLRKRRGANAGLFAVQRLIRRSDTFGFHFLSLDIRHNAEDLQQVVGHCLGDSNWMNHDSAQRAARLRRMLQVNESPVVEPDNDAKRLFSVFRSIAFCRRKYGDGAMGAFLVRHCEGADDILATLLLARWADIHSADGTVALDVVPCFESAAELERAPDVLQQLIDDPYYRRNLDARGLHQTVLLAISDATPDGSVLASRWHMHKAHTQLGALFDAADIDYTFFHGRGSLSGRGGVADGIAHGHLRATEHGEAVNERYGVRGIAVRTLEKAFNAVTTATAGLTSSAPADDAWPDIMDTLSAAGDRAYNNLHTEAFEAYFARATPIDVIDHMRATSAPAGAVDTEHVLRNRPWAFAWAQGRFLLPAWFGFGSAAQEVQASEGVEVLREMLKSWPFFDRLIADVEVALAVTDMGIARHYSVLAGHDLHTKFFPVIEAEFERSVEALLDLRRQTVLLANNTTLRRSIRLRNPYVDPMSLLQVKLLERWRADDRQDDKLLTALRASVNGIARGLQTTG